MLQKTTNLLLFLLKISLLLIVIYYIFSDVSYDLIINSIKSYSLIGLSVVLIVVFIPEFIFSLRWIEATKEKYGFFVALKVHTLASIGTFIAPAKLGELIPIIYFKKYHNINIFSTTATLILVRFLDMLMLGSMFIISAFLLFDDSSLKIISLILLIFLWLLIWIIYFKKKFAYKFCYIIPNRKIKLFLVKTLRSIHQILYKQKILFILFYTFLIWIGYFSITAIFLLFVIKLNLTLGATFVVFVVSSIGMAIPLAPSGLATYQASLILALSWYGVDKDSALSASIILHLIQLFPGIMLYIILFVFSKNKIKFSELYKK